MQHRTVRIWDLPLRLFHWLLVSAVAGALISVQLGQMQWHGRFGLAVIGLLAFRIAWGFVGSTHARFSDFLPTPGTVLSQVRGQGRNSFLGHNPLGALSVCAMLLLFGVQAGTGLFANDDIAFSGPLSAALDADRQAWLTGWHRRLEWVLYGMIALHLGAVAFHEGLRGESLVRPMVTGTRTMQDSAARDATGGGGLALLLALLVAGGALWLANGSWLPTPPPPPPDLGW